MGQRRVTLIFGSILLILAVRNYTWSRKSIQRDLLRKNSELFHEDRELENKSQAEQSDTTTTTTSLYVASNVRSSSTSFRPSRDIDENDDAGTTTDNEESSVGDRDVTVDDFDSSQESHLDTSMLDESDVNVSESTIGLQQEAGENEDMDADPNPEQSPDFVNTTQSSPSAAESNGVNETHPVQSNEAIIHEPDVATTSQNNGTEPIQQMQNETRNTTLMANATAEHVADVVTVQPAENMLDEPGQNNATQYDNTTKLQNETSLLNVDDPVKANATDVKFSELEQQEDTPEALLLNVTDNTTTESEHEVANNSSSLSIDAQIEANATVEDDTIISEDTGEKEENLETTETNTTDSDESNPTEQRKTQPAKKQSKKETKKAKKNKKPKGPSPIPNVLIAGVQKGGTTSIAHYLKETQGACFSDPEAVISQGEGKESHFFDNWKTYNSSGLEYYENVFRHCEGNKLIVDGTPEFMKTGQRICDTYTKHGSIDNLKIIMSLREPVSREISWYNHRLRDCPEQAYALPVCNVNTGEVIPFLDVAQKELAWKLSNNETKNVYGTYVQYLETFFELFDRKNILILSYEEAKNDQKALLQRIHKFLGLPGKPKVLPHVNSDEGKHEMPPCPIQRALARRFEPYNEALYELLEANPGPKMEQRPFPKFTNKCFAEMYPEDEPDPFQKLLPKPSKHIVPNILVAGAQQTLTSAVAKYCSGIMQGCESALLPDTEEDAAFATHFFDNSNKFKKGLSFYQSLFEQCASNETAVFDASADLIMFPRRVREIYERQGQADSVKMIFLLRDPVQREIESFHIRARKCETDPSGEVCSKKGKAMPFEPFVEERVIAKLEKKKFDYMVGVYAQYLKVWFEIWDRKQILILRYEELQNKPKRFLGRIHAFLGIKNPAASNDLEIFGPTAEVSCEIREKMSLQFEEHNKALYELLEANPGPKMEQKPFPEFETHKCSS